ncbi:TatD family hydrolase [Halioxenophilus aromaticivorans]|uniref:TatD family hydrolase n=1 Tax=Halioxenophilus aromaticivorans TaxID=1306992 RepID=A0AAV3U4P7_9ALTE
MNNTLHFVDSHCHIDAPVFNDIASTLAVCRAQGVQDIVVPGLYEAQWQTLRKLADEHTVLHIACGRHPWWIGENDDLSIFAQALLENAEASCCVAIGETGIDGLRGVDVNLQQRWFEQHLKVAEALNKPIVVHAVRAHPLIQRTLAKYKGLVRGVIHGFSGSPELAQQYWKLGFHLGIGGTITYPRGSKTQQAVKALPLEAIVLETDAPDMPLQGRQGQPNHPVRVLDVAARVAELRQEPLNVIAHQTTANSQRLFDLVSQ